MLGRRGVLSLFEGGSPKSSLGKTPNIIMVAKVIMMVKMIMMLRLTITIKALMISVMMTIMMLITRAKMTKTMVKMIAMTISAPGGD